MNVGAPELLIVLLVLTVAAVGIAVPLAGIVRASRNGDSRWIVAIAVAWCFGLGWLVALIYLLVGAPEQDAPRRSSLATAPVAPGGWHPDPSGRFDLRYHDGVRWTGHVTAGGRQAIDPAAPPH